MLHDRRILLIKRQATPTEKGSKMKIQCEDCGKMVEEKNCNFDEENSPHCKKCTKEMVLPCSVCGKDFPMWEMTCTFDGEDTYCEHCATAYN